MLVENSTALWGDGFAAPRIQNCVAVLRLPPAFLAEKQAISRACSGLLARFGVPGAGADVIAAIGVGVGNGKKVGVAVDEGINCSFF